MGTDRDAALAGDGQRSVPSPRVTGMKPAPTLADVTMEAWVIVTSDKFQNLLQIGIEIDE